MASLAGTIPDTVLDDMPVAFMLRLLRLEDDRCRREGVG